MLDVPNLSEAKLALLKKYLRGDLATTTTAFRPITPQQTVTDATNPRAPVMAVQAGGSRQPFFFLHGDWTGNSFFCFSLARDLGPDQPFYVLEPYAFDDLQILPTVEVMAAAHLKSLRTIQPEGPYHLGGFCNGGLLAYEMVRQLHAEGQKVELVVLMDSIPTRLTLVCNLIERIGRLMRLRQGEALNWFLRLQHIYRYLLDRKSEDFEFLRTIDRRIDSFFPPVELLHREYPAMFIWATANYKPGFYSGKVTLFWDEGEPVRREWWRKMARNKDEEVEVHIIPGTHKTCKTEHVHGMGKHLRACLSQAQTDAKK